MKSFNGWSPLLQAGAFGALHGGHPGDAAVGLGVRVMNVPDFREALRTLADLKLHATLLVAEELTRDGADDLWRATQAGHEVAGLNLPLNYRRLEALTGQQVRFWALPHRGLSRRMLQSLQNAGITPLPAAARAPVPGALLHVTPGELRQTVTHLRSLGYRAVPVGQLRGLRVATPGDLLHDLYQRIVEERYAERAGVIDLSQRFDAVLRVAPLDHAPPPLPLPHGTPTAELHLNSTRLVGLASANWSATYKAYQRSLRDVAQALQSHPQLQDAQAVFAVTLFHGPLEKAGFTISELPPLRARWYGLGFRLLRLAYGTTRTPGETTPKMGWMTREDFLKRYGTAS